MIIRVARIGVGLILERSKARTRLIIPNRLWPVAPLRHPRLNPARLKSTLPRQDWRLAGLALRVDRLGLVAEQSLGIMVKLIDNVPRTDAMLSII